MNPVLTPTSQRPLDFISPRIGDLLFFERVPVEKVVNNASLSYGSAHPKPSQYPNHKLAAIKADPNEAGMQRLYWLAERSSQQDYNWELEDDTSEQWPRLTQTWVILRSSFTGLNMAVTAPSAYGHTWTRIGERERRTGDEITDGLFVILQVIYEDITNPLRKERIDEGSGQVVSMSIKMVPVGTAGQAADAQGYITTVDPINTHWGIATTDRISAAIGTGVRSYSKYVPYPWPPVLMGFRLRLNVDLSYGYDYALKTWDGECLVNVREYWNLTPPAMSAPTNLGKTGIRWNGSLVNIDIPECLHGIISITETANGRTVFRNYPRTPLLDWPTSIVVYPSVHPFPGGGYWVTEWSVFSPVGIVG